MCQSDSAYMRTKQGKDLLGDTCSAFIVIDYADGTLPYMVELQLQSEKKNMQKNKEIFLDYIKTGIDMPAVGEGKTSFTTILKVTPIFNDLTRQHPDFTTVIAYLVKYKVLMANRVNFDGDMPMTRGDVLKVYFK